MPEALEQQRGEDKFTPENRNVLIDIQRRLNIILPAQIALVKGMVPKDAVEYLEANRERDEIIQSLWAKGKLSLQQGNQYYAADPRKALEILNPYYEKVEAIIERDSIIKSGLEDGVITPRQAAVMREMPDAQEAARLVAEKFRDLFKVSEQELPSIAKNAKAKTAPARRKIATREARERKKDKRRADDLLAGL